MPIGVSKTEQNSTKTPFQGVQLFPSALLFQLSIHRPIRFQKFGACGSASFPGL